MSDAVTLAFGVTDAGLLGSGWESTIYALGKTQILRIPRPEVGSENQVRAQAACGLSKWIDELHIPTHPSPQQCTHQAC